MEKKEMGGGGEQGNYVVHVYTHNDKNRRQVFTGILQEIYVYTYIEEKREVWVNVCVDVSYIHIYSIFIQYARSILL